VDETGSASSPVALVSVSGIEVLGSNTIIIQRLLDQLFAHVSLLF